MGGQVSSCSCCTASSRATRGKGLRAQLCNAIDRSSKASKQKVCRATFAGTCFATSSSKWPKSSKCQTQTAHSRRDQNGLFSAPKGSLVRWSESSRPLEPLLLPTVPNGAACCCKIPKPHPGAKNGEVQPDVSLMLGDDATHECQHSEKSKR